MHICIATFLMGLNGLNQKGNYKSGKLQQDRLEDFYGLLNNHLSSFSKSKLFKGLLAGFGVLLIKILGTPAPFLLLVS